METLIHTNLESDGVLVATIDMPGRRMNVFSAELMDALDALMDRVDRDSSITCVVLTSGKPTFLAGAELNMVRGFTSSAKTLGPAELRALCGRLGRQFVRLEDSVKPWVAAVNGLALGGGLELAAACRERLVTDDPRTQIGVPEVRWGLLPGAGGTQRLPRFAGFEAGMKLLLSGISISPAEAVGLHMFARAVPGAQLLDMARARARALRETPYDPRVKFANLAQADVPPPGEQSRHEIAAKLGISNADFADYPAYRAIIDSVLEGARLPLAQATEVEMTQFLTLMNGAVAGRMVRTLYLERQNADKAIAIPESVGIERIGMGAVDDGWRAALAKIKVPCVPDEAAGANSILVVDKAGKSHSVLVAGVESATPAQLVLSKAGPYGRVLEIVGASDSEAPLFAALAARLGAMPWRTAGPASVLQRLFEARGSLAEQARVALACASENGDSPLAHFDVAACLAAVTPAWTGGPLTYLWAERETLVPQLDPNEKRLWATLEPALAQACA